MQVPLVSDRLWSGEFRQSMVRMLAGEAGKIWLEVVTVASLGSIVSFTWVSLYLLGKRA